MPTFENPVAEGEFQNEGAPEPDGREGESNVDGDANSRQGVPSIGVAALVFLAALAASFVVALVLASASGGGEKPAGISAQGIAAQVAFAVTLAGGVLFWASRRSGWAALRLADRRWLRPVVVGLAAGLLLQFVTLALVYLASRLIPGFDPAKVSGPIERHIADSSMSIKIALAFVSIAVAPVSEELFFRGMLLASLERLGGRLVAVLFTSILFGLAHFNVYSFVPLAAVGAAFALMDIRSGTLASSIGAHVAFNSTAVVGLLAMALIR